MSSEMKKRLLARLKPEMMAVEEALKENLTTKLSVVAEAAGHILFSGGKRLRPLLMVLSARLCGYRGEEDIKLSTVFEYLHAATLLHDDLVDDAALRRGKPVAHSIWGNSLSVLVGDFLLARSLSIICESGNFDIMKVIAGITEDMSQGEIHQLIKKGSLDLEEEEYMEVIRRKTAVLIRGACQVGAILGGASTEKEKALSDYGHNIGMAFQMADDLLDYLSDAKALGKEVGADLREGKMTLPLIRSLRAASPEDARTMEKTVKNESFSQEEFHAFKGLLEKYGGIEYTKRKAAEHVEKAKEAISVFSPSETRGILEYVADYALERKE